MDYVKLDFPESGLAAVREWIENFVAKPNPAIERTGAVCPFMPRALKLNSIYGKTIPAADTHALRRAIDSAIVYLKQISDPADPNCIYNAVLLLLPQADAGIMKYVRNELKQVYLRERIMVGGFHKESLRSSIHAEEFFPMQSPLPMVAIRHFVPGDLPFLMRECDDLEKRKEYLRHYINAFGDDLYTADRRKIAAVMDD